MQDRKELSPWLKKRLLENKLQAVPGKPIGESNTRLTRQVISRFKSISMEHPRIPLSSPFVSLKTENPAPSSSWGELRLLLTQPANSQAEDEKPGYQKPLEVSRNYLKRQEIKADSTPEQPPGRSQQRVTPAPRPFVARAVRGKIEEVSEKTDKIAASGETRAVEPEIRGDNLKSVVPNTENTGTLAVTGRGFPDLAPKIPDITTESKTGPGSKIITASSGEKTIVARKPVSQPVIEDQPGKIPAAQTEKKVSRPPDSQNRTVASKIRSEAAPLKGPPVRAASFPGQTVDRQAAETLKRPEVSKSGEGANSQIFTPVGLSKKEMPDTSGRKAEKGEKPEIPATPGKRLSIDFRPVFRRIFRRPLKDKPISLNSHPPEVARKGGDSLNEIPDKKLAMENSSTAEKAAPILESEPKSSRSSGKAGVSGVISQDLQLELPPARTTVFRPKKSGPVSFKGQPEPGRPFRFPVTVSRQKSGLKPGNKPDLKSGNNVAVNSTPAPLNSSITSPSDTAQRTIPKLPAEPGPVKDTDAAIKGGRPAGPVDGGPGKPVSMEHTGTMEVSMPVLARRAAHSKDLPVQRLLKPGASIGASGDNGQKPSPEFLSPPALEFTLAKSSQTRAKTQVSSEGEIFRQSSASEFSLNRAVNQPPIEQVVSRAVNIKESEPEIQTQPVAQASKEAQDLKKLARELYPHIKRMIIIEKERSSH